MTSTVTLRPSPSPSPHEPKCRLEQGDDVRSAINNIPEEGEDMSTCPTETTKAAALDLQPSDATQNQRAPSFSRVLGFHGSKTRKSSPPSSTQGLTIDTKTPQQGSQEWGLRSAPLIGAKNGDAKLSKKDSLKKIFHRTPSFTPEQHEEYAIGNGDKAAMHSSPVKDEPVSPKDTGRRQVAFDALAKRPTSLEQDKSFVIANRVSHIPDLGAGSKARRLSSSDLSPTPPLQEFGEKYEYLPHIPFHHKKIGKGATADVRTCHRIGDAKKTVVALKVFRGHAASETQDEHVEKLYSEYKITKNLDHPNIIDVFDLVIEKHKSWCHVMEYCDGGDLLALILKDFMGAVEKYCCFKQLLRGVAYLHSNGIVHRDVKPENLLMTRCGTLKITDFGVSDRVVEGGLSRGFCGSEPYMSPEIFSGGEYDARKLDVWSCGIVFYTLLFQGTPFSKPVNSDQMYARYVSDIDKMEKLRERDIDAYEKAKETETDPIPPPKEYTPKFPPFEMVGLSYDKRIKRLLSQVLKLNPSERPSAEEVLKMDWIARGIDCCCPDVNTMTDAKMAGVDATRADACRKASDMHVSKEHHHVYDQKFHRPSRAATFMS